MMIRIPHTRAAFTLMELTVSLAVSAMLMAALGSAVAIAAAALPAENSVQTRVLDTSRALEHVSADLESAVYILSTDAASPTYGIPDRDQDGATDTQALSWSGKREDSIQLVENGATPETVLGGASDFNATFSTQSVVESLGTRLEESSVFTLSSYPAAATAAFAQNLEPDILWCQYMAPTLPDGAIYWTVEEIEIAGIRVGDNKGVVTAQLRAMNAGEPPSDTIFEEVTFKETQFGNGAVKVAKIQFSGDVELDPGQHVGLLIAFSTGSDAAGAIVHEDGAGEGLWTADISTGLLDGLLGDLLGGDETPDWEAAPGPWQMLYVLNGRYCTQESAGQVTHTFATTVNVSVTATGETDVQMDTTVNLVNRPQLVDSIWEARFSTDPTQHDINADGIADWARTDAGVFATANLADGVWDPRHDLMTQPPKDMTGVVIAEIDWRCTDSAQSGVMWTLNFDQAGGVQGNVTVHLAKANDSEQSLAMTTNDGAGTTDTLASVGGLPLEMVRVRVLIDPEGDAVSLWVNGGRIGAYEYHSSPYTDEERVSTITPLGTGVQIDAVRIREGGAP